MMSGCGQPESCGTASIVQMGNKEKKRTDYTGNVGEMLAGWSFSRGTDQSMVGVRCV
jgi:hypothetical protein